jgi:hypothetical protein
MDKTLTEQKIQRVLNKFMASPKYKVDGLFVFRWESDKLLWTKSGYIYEFEIKISRADYKNDFKHKAEKHLLLSSKMPKEAESVQLDLFDNLLKQKQKRYPGITKEQLNTYPENTKLPNFFYYAVPEGMLEPDEVPPYAGLIYITTSKGPKYHRDDPDKYYHDIKIVRKAPQLHKTKYTDAELNLGEKFYYNMQTWKHNYREQVNYSLMYRQRLQDELKRKGIDKSYLEMADALKEAVRRAEYAEHNVATYKQMNYNLQDDANYNRIERHMFMDLVKELKPDFDYKEFTKKVDERYKERYPNRK